VDASTNRIRIGQHILAIALLPIISIAATMLILLFALGHVDVLREQQQGKRVAMQELTRLIPNRVVDTVGQAGGLSDAASRKAQYIAEMRKEWTAVLDKVENAFASQNVHNMLHEVSTEFGKFDGLTADLAWMRSIGSNEIAPLENQRLRDEVVRCASPAPKQLQNLTSALEQEILEDKPSFQFLQLARWIAIGGFVATCLSSVAAVGLFSLKINRRLRVLGENARRLAAEETLATPLAGDDEIASLDRNFHEMAAALKEAREEEQAAISNSADLICVLDQSLKILEVNPACGALLGVAPADLVGKPVSGWIAPELLNATMSELAILQATPELRSFETQLKTAGQTVLDVLWSGFYLEEEKAIFCIVHDISNRKQVERLVAAEEARERVLMERIPAGLLTYDASDCVLAANRRAERMLGVEGIVGKSAAQCLRVGSGLQVSVNKVGDRFLAVILDQRDRQQFQQVRERFLSMIAHDIATPLTNIGGTFTLYAAGIHGQLNEGGLRKIQSAEAESQRLVRLFKDLLRVEKHGNMELEIGTEAVDLAQLVQQAMSGVAEQADRSGVALKSTVSTIEIRVDPDRIVQVFINLLTNALKFAPHGSAITISAGIADNRVELRVADEGPGIPPDMLEAIFEPFKQVSVEDATVRGGSGLGLAICKQIVTAHGGTIRASNAARGAVLTVTLPYPAG
jgi:PAS domain S-box-containing protein